MPYFSASHEWLQQSSLLLQARPTTARVTSKYTVIRPDDSRVKKRQRLQKHADASRSSATASETSSQAPVASFTLKTYDPESGACLKYRTAKAAEVGRLIASLGKLARCMAALPELAEETLPDAADHDPGTSTPAAHVTVKDQKPVASESKAPASGGVGGGGGKKKKKGKK